MDGQHGDKEIRNLKCDLRKDEVNSRGEQVAILVGESADLEQARKDANDTAKKENQRCESSITRLSRQVRERAEWRDVECAWERDDADQTMRLVRTDTGEVVWHRPLTSDEKQIRMFEGGVVGSAE